MKLFFGKRFRTILILFFVAFASYGTTTTPLDSLQILPEVVVKADGHDAEIRSTAPLQILTKKSLEGLNVLQISDAVKHFSGVTVKDYGGVGGLKTVSVRSLGANHTAVSYDGITLTDVQTGQIDIGRFSLDNVDMLSLHSGQSDKIFQPARLFASASVLNIITQKPTFAKRKPFNGKIGFKTGSWALVNPTASLNWQISPYFSFSGSGEWLQTHGEYPYTLAYGVVGKDSTSVEKRQNTDVQNGRVEGTLFVQISPKSKGYLKSYFYQSERGLPGATIYYNTINFSSQRIKDNTFFVQGHWQQTLSQKWEMQFNTKYNRGYLYYLDPTYLDKDGKTENNYTQEEWYYSVATLFKVFRNFSLSASTDFAINTLDADLYKFAYPTRFTSLSVFATKYVDNHFLATASLLYTHTEERVQHGKASENQRKFSPYLSVSLKPFNSIDLRMRLFYKNIFRLPTFNDLYYSRIGNPDLKPEDTHQFNVGVTYATVIGKWLPHLSLTADMYHNDVKNKIVAYPTKNIFEWTMLNYGKVSIDGVDVNVETAFRLYDQLQLVAGTSYTYQRALNVTNKADRDYGHQIPYTPRVSGSANVGLETPWGQISYAMLWSGHRYAVNQNYAENNVKGYTDHSLSLSRAIALGDSRLNINIEFLNILDENYEVVRFFPMPGRSIRGTINWKF